MRSTKPSAGTVGRTRMQTFRIVEGIYEFEIGLYAMFHKDWLGHSEANMRRQN
jgi:hypothetical protein